jgi:hypothetical protein
MDKNKQDINCNQRGFKPANCDARPREGQAYSLILTSTVSVDYVTSSSARLCILQPGCTSFTHGCTLACCTYPQRVHLTRKKEGQETSHSTAPRRAPSGRGMLTGRSNRLVRSVFGVAMLVVRKRGGGGPMDLALTRYT